MKSKEIELREFMSEGSADKIEALALKFFDLSRLGEDPDGKERIQIAAAAISVAFVAIDD